MKRRLVLSLALLLLGCSVAACGSDSSKPAFPPPPSTVGTLSQESLQQPIIRDTEAVRNALNSGQADEAFQGVYELINRAVADTDVKHGAATIRRELPALVRTFDTSYPSTRNRILRVKLETRAGERLRRFGIYVLDQDAAALRSFNADVARSRLTFGAAERFGEANNAMVRHNSVRLAELIRTLTPAERAAAQKAVREVFGSG